MGGAARSEWRGVRDHPSRFCGGVPPTEGVASRDASAPVGCISWLDLTVSDASATRDFYRQVVDWSVQDDQMEDASERYADYNMFGADGSPAAGVCHARGSVNLGLPPIWMIYPSRWRRGRKSPARTRGRGKVIKATRGTDGEFAYAVVQDPVGVCMTL